LDQPNTSLRFDPSPSPSESPLRSTTAAAARRETPPQAMQPSPGPSQAALPSAVAAELAQLERRLGQVAEEPARRELGALGEAPAVRILRRIGRSQREVRTLTGYIITLARQEAFALNAQAVPTAESAACSSSSPCLRGEV